MIVKSDSRQLLFFDKSLQESAASSVEAAPQGLDKLDLEPEIVQPTSPTLQKMRCVIHTTK